MPQSLAMPRQALQPTVPTTTHAPTRLPLELHDIMFSYLTMVDVIAWRNVSRRTCLTATLFLQRHLHVLLAPFVPDPTAFLDELFHHRALIGGMSALAFMILDQDLRFPSLDVYAPDLLYPALVTALHSMLHEHLMSITVISTVYATSIREIVETTTLRSHAGRAISVHRSSTWSALLPICRSPSSLLFNYVSRTSFGCAYPALTLRHRGLLADTTFYHALPQDIYAMNALTDQGFNISWSPTRFAKEDEIARRLRILNPSASVDLTLDVVSSELRADLLDRPATYARRFRPVWGAPPFHTQHSWSTISTWTYLQGTQQCFSRQNMCPQQVRFFGDASSLVDFLDPMCTDRQELEEKCMPPYGTVVAWKLCSSYRCGGVVRCGPIEPDTMLLDNGFVHLPALSGKTRFDRRNGRHHPPIYLYHAY